MKKVKRLSLTLIIISLFSISALTTASAQGAPGMAPPGAPTDAPDPDPEIITDEEDHCQAMPPGAEQDECYIAEDDDAGPEDAHCEDLHAGDGPPLWEPTDADIDRFEGEYRENMKTGQGRLNEGTIAEIMSHGLTRAEVDCHVQEMAEAAMHDQEADEAPPAAVTAEVEGGAAGQPGMPPGTMLVRNAMLVTKRWLQVECLRVECLQVECLQVECRRVECRRVECLRDNRVRETLVWPFLLVRNAMLVTKRWLHSLKKLGGVFLNIKQFPSISS